MKFPVLFGSCFYSGQNIESGELLPIKLEMICLNNFFPNISHISAKSVSGSAEIPEEYSDNSFCPARSRMSGGGEGIREICSPIYGPSEFQNVLLRFGQVPRFWLFILIEISNLLEVKRLSYCENTAVACEVL